MAKCVDVYVYNTHQLEKSAYLPSINGSFTFIDLPKKAKHFSKFTYDVKFELKKIISSEAERWKALFVTQFNE